MKKYTVKYTDSNTIVTVTCDEILSQDGFLVFVKGVDVVLMVNPVYVRSILRIGTNEQN
jgi:hypothetical protein